MPKRGRFSRGPVGLARMTQPTVMKFVAPEKKYFDVLIAASNLVQDTETRCAADCGFSSGLTPISGSASAGIAQGAGAQNRIGAKIGITGFTSRIQLSSFSQANEDVDDVIKQSQVRVMLVLDKQSNGDLAATSAILDDTLSQALAHRNLANTARFRVLYDKVHTLTPETVATTTGASPLFGVSTVFKHFTINKSFKKPILRQYSTVSSTTSGSPDLVLKNQLIMVFVNMNPALKTSAVNLACNNRFRFIDA